MVGIFMQAFIKLSVRAYFHQNVDLIPIAYLGSRHAECAHAWLIISVFGGSGYSKLKYKSYGIIFPP